MSAQMIQTNLNNGKAQAAQVSAAGFTGRGNMRQFDAMLSALAATAVAKANAMKLQASAVTK